MSVPIVSGTALGRDGVVTKGSDDGGQRPSGDSCRRVLAVVFVFVLGAIVLVDDPVKGLILFLHLFFAWLREEEQIHEMPDQEAKEVALLAQHDSVFLFQHKNGAQTQTELLASTHAYVGAERACGILLIG